jgi:hypothetical protein
MEFFFSGDKAISETSESIYMQVFMVREGVTGKGDKFSTHRTVDVHAADGNAPDQNGKHIERNCKHLHCSRFTDA